MIEKWRRDSGLTQNDLHKAIGASQQSVSAWERGVSYPSLYYLVKMCRVFRCTLDELVQGEIVDGEPYGKVEEEEVPEQE